MEKYKLTHMRRGLDAYSYHRFLTIDDERFVERMFNVVERKLGAKNASINLFLKHRNETKS